LKRKEYIPSPNIFLENASSAVTYSSDARKHISMRDAGLRPQKRLLAAPARIKNASNGDLI